MAYAEARADFARKLREKGLTRTDHEAVKKALDTDWPRFFVLNLNPLTAKSAGDLAEKHALRGFDALHLAAGLNFAIADALLQKASRLEGLAPVWIESEYGFSLKLQKKAEARKQQRFFHYS